MPDKWRQLQRNSKKRAGGTAVDAAHLASLSSAAEPIGNALGDRKS